MTSSTMVLQRTPSVLLNLSSVAARSSSAKSCLHILRRFSQTQSWAIPESHHVPPLSFQSYPLPSKLPSAPRNEPVPETSIASPMTIVPEMPSPSQPKAAAQPVKESEQEAQKSKPVTPKRKLRPRKAALKLTPTAVEQLRQLLNQPEPKLIKVGVRNRGCSGLAYHLEYVDKPGAFDEEVEQDGVKVVIDSKALFSIIGSEMDWVEDKLNQRFIFRNPNIKEECGCGESFMV
ncbi:hypothetical protein GGR50DRAFT_356840 [Xylaria sp. CBS 124048]|nr:hypothetical protein GGR50DRAFT_356840 [Xylaria sp. CBS 124048]